MGKNQQNQSGGPKNNFGGGKFGGGKFGGGKFGGGKFGGGKFGGGKFGGGKFGGGGGGGGKFGGGKFGGGKPQFNSPKGGDFGERDGSGDKETFKHKQNKFRNDGVPLSKMQSGSPKFNQQNNKNAKKRKADESDVSLQFENLEAQMKPSGAGNVEGTVSEPHTDSTKKRVKFDDSRDSIAKSKRNTSENLGNGLAKGKLKFDEDASSIESSDDLEDEELGTDGEEDTDILDESDSLDDEEEEEESDEEEEKKEDTPKGGADKKPLKLESSAADSPRKTEKLSGTPNLKKPDNKNDGQKVASNERVEKIVDSGQSGKVVLNAALKEKEEKKKDEEEEERGNTSRDQNLAVITKALLEALQKPKVEDAAELDGKGLTTFMRKLNDKKQAQFRVEIEQLKLKYLSEK